MSVYSRVRPSLVSHYRSSQFPLRPFKVPLKASKLPLRSSQVFLRPAILPLRPLLEALLLRKKRKNVAFQDKKVSFDIFLSVIIFIGILEKGEIIEIIEYEQQQTVRA